MVSGSIFSLGYQVLFKKSMIETPTIQVVSFVLVLAFGVRYAFMVIQVIMGK